MPAFWRNVTSIRTVASLAAVVFAGSAFGQNGAPNFIMTWDASNDTVGAQDYNWEQYGQLTDNGDDSFTYVGELYGGNDLWRLTWDCTFDPDPFVTANIVVTNNDVNPQNFSLLMTLPIAPAVPSPTIDGSVSGTLTDLGANGAQVNALTGGSIYTSFIDGNIEETLLNDPFSVAIPFGGAAVGPAAFGPQAAAEASADTSIAILLEFQLSPGDSASFTSIFNVVPGPGGLSMLAVMGLFSRGRRRRD